jgi:glycosyltransferase involved in cell wall biosynthesis
MPRKRQIVFCTDNLGVGGTELNAVRTCENLDRDRFDLRLLALNDQGPLRDRYERAGVPITRWPIGPLYSPRTVVQILRLARLFKAWKTDVVHCHDRYTNLVGVMAGRLAGVPLVIASKRWGETTRQHHLTSAVSFRAAHRVLANGASTAASLVAVDRISPRKVVVVPNFVDNDAFDPPPDGWIQARRDELGIPEDAMVAGIVASLRPVKDQPTLLRAVAAARRRFPRLHLVLVGDGPSRHELQGLADSLGIGPWVHFAGIRPQLPSMHHLFDVSFLTSRSEGFPNALIEAMAASRPIIGTDVTGVRDAIRHGQNGLLVPPANPGAMAEALCQLLSDESTRVRMGAAGRALARSDFSVEGALGRLEDLYLEGTRETT